jgi:hypothetical protein
VGTPEGKKVLGRPRHILEDNIKIYFQEILREAVNFD